MFESTRTFTRFGCIESKCFEKIKKVGKDDEGWKSQRERVKQLS